MPYTDFEKIKTLIKNRKLSHAVVLEGSQDTTLDIAVKVAAGLFCQNDGFYCGKCKDCTTVLAHSHSDMLILEPAKTNYAKDQMKELVTQANLLPFVAQGRTFIITQAEKLREDAQNVILKVLEEPPAGVHFIFCVTNHRLLLPTILSRATVFSFIEETQGEYYDIAQKLLQLGSTKKRYDILKILYGITSLSNYTALLTELKSSAAKAAYKEGNAAKYILLAEFIDKAKDRLTFNPSLRLLSDVLCTKLCL